MDPSSAKSEAGTETRSDTHATTDAVAGAATRGSERNYRLLVDRVTDYAIYMLDAGGTRDQLEQRRATDQAIYRR